MREGNKETAVGWIPEEWEVLKLDNCIEKIIGGGTPSRKNEMYWNGNIPWATVKDLKNAIIKDTEEAITEDGLKNSAANVIPAYTIIMSTRMAVGKAVFFTKNVAINQDLKAVFPNQFLNKYYLFHWFAFNATNIGELGSGSTVKGIRLEVLKNLDIAIPPLPEQTKIASILSTVDDKLDSISNRIEVTRKLKQGLMQRLLTQGIGHTKFKDSPLGRIPEGWEVDKLNKIVSQFIVPMRDKPKIFDGDIPWCRIEDFNGIYLSASKSGRHVSQQTIEEMNLKVYPVGTVLVSCSADLGRCAITQNPLTTNQTFIGLVPKSETNGLLLYYKMISAASRLNSLSSGTTISYLSRESFENFVLSFPQSEDEQCEISSILFTVDKKLGILEERNNEYKQLKKGLMQQLLTGRMRVNR